jgi:hypothetical protein
MRNARRILESELLEEPDLDTEDAALDFIEQVVGRHYFVQNWPRFFPKEKEVALWLKDHPEYRTDGAKVLAKIDLLAKQGERWAR